MMVICLMNFMNLTHSEEEIIFDKIIVLMILIVELDHFKIFK